MAIGEEGDEERGDEAMTAGAGTEVDFEPQKGGFEGNDRVRAQLLFFVVLASRLSLNLVSSRIMFGTFTRCWKDILSA